MNKFDASKLRSDKKPEFVLTVDTGDEGAEVFVVNSQFQRVDRKCGKLVNFLLPRGLYLVRVRTGTQYDQKYVDLVRNDKISFTQVVFTSSAPMEGTGKTHEWQIESAQQQSLRPHVYIGLQGNGEQVNGSQIYVYCRDWTSASDRASRKSVISHPATGLTLRDREGNVLVDFTDPAYPRDILLADDSWSACNVDLQPGIYYLHLDTGSDEILQMAVVASFDWQTQIFMLQHDYGPGPNGRRADLAGASVFMERRGKGFYSKKREYVPPFEINYRLTEIARQALKNDRRIMNETISNMLDEKGANPMLGIYGAHLMLMDNEPNMSLLKRVIENLRRLIGFEHPHPDVEALALKVGLESNYVFDMPPMLRRSWNYMLEASVNNPDIVPEDSMISQISGLLWSENPWLIWGELQTEFNKSIMLAQQVSKYMGYGAGHSIDDQFGKLDTPYHKSFLSKNIKSFSDLSDKDKQQLVQSTQVPLSKLTSIINDLDMNHLSPMGG